MERGLQKANHYNQLAEWGQRVEACRKSGLSEWYSEQGIPVSTCYSWQRKVFQAVTAEPEVCFTEISGRAASIEKGELRIRSRRRNAPYHPLGTGRILTDFKGAERVYIASGYTDLRRRIDGFVAIQLRRGLKCICVGTSLGRLSR